MFPACILDIFGHFLNLRKQNGEIEMLGRSDKKRGNKYQKLGKAANKRRNVACKVSTSLSDLNIMFESETPFQKFKSEDKLDRLK